LEVAKFFDTAIPSVTNALRVLLVEDDTDLRLTLAQALEEESYAVDTAEDVRTASTRRRRGRMTPSSSM
jgi:DNA-binding NtrC family response regulator